MAGQYENSSTWGNKENGINRRVGEVNDEHNTGLITSNKSVLKL